MASKFIFLILAYSLYENFKFKLGIKKLNVKIRNFTKVGFIKEFGIVSKSVYKVYRDFFVSLSSTDPRTYLHLNVCFYLQHYRIFKIFYSNLIYHSLSLLLCKNRIVLYWGTQVVSILRCWKGIKQTYIFVAKLVIIF